MKKKYYTSISLPQHVIDDIKIRAMAENRSVCNFISTIVMNYLAAEDEKKRSQEKATSNAKQSTEGPQPLRQDEGAS